MSQYIQVDPSTLSVPQDAKDIPRFLLEIKDTLVAMNQNLATFIGTAGTELANLGTTVGTHATGLTNLNNLMVQAMSAQATALASGAPTTGSRTRAPKLEAPSKFD